MHSPPQSLLHHKLLCTAGTTAALIHSRAAGLCASTQTYVSGPHSHADPSFLCPEPPAPEDKGVPILQLMALPGANSKEPQIMQLCAASALQQLAVHSSNVLWGPAPCGGRPCNPGTRSARCIGVQPDTRPCRATTARTMHPQIGGVVGWHREAAALHACVVAPVGVDTHAGCLVGGAAEAAAPGLPL